MKKQLFICLLILSISINAQQVKPKKQRPFIGSWSLVSINNIYQDGSRKTPYGEKPKGVLIFDAKGNYAIQIMKANRPLIVSGNKNSSTPEENAALIKGFNAHFGTYVIDSIYDTITFNIMHASFPNWENQTQKRNYTHSNNELKYIVTNTTQGGASVIAEVVWRKR